MPRKMRSPKRRIQIEITDTEFNLFLDGEPEAFVGLPEARKKELWRQYEPDILDEYRRRNGLFSRPNHWWTAGNRRKARLRGTPLPDENTCDTWYGLPVFAMDSPENFETAKGFFMRHPELQTDEEREWLTTNKFSSWEFMGASEIADTDYLLKHIHLLSAAEQTALKSYVYSTIQ
jgi:hypothetical protein